MSTLMPIFCFNFIFILISFSITSFFYSITLFYFIFVLCRRLQCGHSCQYFVSTLISFLIHFPLLLFLIYIFLLNNIILLFLCCVDDCNVNTHANILVEL